MRVLSVRQIVPNVQLTNQQKIIVRRGCLGHGVGCGVGQGVGRGGGGDGDVDHGEEGGGGLIVTVNDLRQRSTEVAGQSTLYDRKLQR